MTTAVATSKANRVMKVQLADAALLHTPDGVLKCVDTSCALNVADDSLVRMGHMKQTIVDDKGREQDAPVFLITAKGWSKIADQCGVVVFAHDTVMVNGVLQQNGYQDPETGAIYFRSVAVGYTAAGRTSRERTVMYDANLANLSDLISKAKQKWAADAFKILPFRGMDEHGFYRGEPGETWAAYRLDDAMVLWVDTMHSGVAKWQGEMLNRKEKALRTCQTFADRNAIAAHPATPTNAKFPTSAASLRCRRWVPNDGTDMKLTKSMIYIDRAMLEAAEEAAADDPDKDEIMDISEAVEEVDHADTPLQVSDVREPDAPPAEGDDDLPLDDAPKAPAEQQEMLTDQPKKPELDRKTLLAEGENLEKQLDDAPLQKARAVCKVGVDTQLKMLGTEKLNELVSLYRAAV